MSREAWAVAWSSGLGILPIFMINQLHIYIKEEAMSPDRRKVLRAMIAAMAASGLTVAERRALAKELTNINIFARPIGKKLASLVNDYFGSDKIAATASRFQTLFGADGKDYKFGHWILKDDPYLGNPHYPGMSNAQWQKLVDQEMEPEITAALTAAIRTCLTASEPTMIHFEVGNHLSGNPYHTVTISSSKDPPLFKDKYGRVISMKCNRG
jgi:hypothetical protein